MTKLEKTRQPMICIDAELEQPYTREDTKDSKLDKSTIIQLGWVIFNDREVLKSQRKYVNIGVPLSQFIKKLTKITDDQIAAGGTLNEAYDALVADQKEFNTIRVVRQWGHGDMEHLKMEILTEQVGEPRKWEFGGGGFNVKHMYQAYALANELNTSGGLSKCMGRLGISFYGKKHDALNDAKSTAIMYNYLEKAMVNTL